MAKKIEEPAEPPDSPPRSSPTQGSSSPSSNGTVPRRYSNSEQMEAARREARGRRRRLDSLNVDMPDDSLSFGYPRFLESVRHYLPNTRPERPPQQETINEGQELYLHFLHEQLRQERLDEVAAREMEGYHDASAHVSDEDAAGDASMASFLWMSSRHSSRRRMSMNLENFNYPMWRQTGRDLRSLAQRFARSSERESVRRRAESIDIGSLDSGKFMDLLKELFSDGDVTQTRILVLFFFCSDLAIRAVRLRIDGLLSKLTQWTLEFIRERVCSWVQRNGGWYNVFSSGLDLFQRMAMFSACVAVITACSFYVWRNLN